FKEGERMSSDIKDLRIVEEAKRPLAMNPKKFALWLFMISVVMLFGAWTSAYLVKRADAGWAEIILPQIFQINTVIVALSSISMIWAIRSAKRDNMDHLKIALGISFILGIVSLVGKYLAYGQMVELNQYFSGDRKSVV